MVEYVENPSSPEYDLSYDVRNVRHQGELRFKGKSYFLTRLLAGERVGLKEIAEGRVQLDFGIYTIGVLNLHNKKIEPFKNT